MKFTIFFLNLIFCAQAFCQTDYGNGIIVQRFRGAVRDVYDQLREHATKNTQGVDMAKLKLFAQSDALDINITEEALFDGERNPIDTRIRVDSDPSITLYRPAWQFYLNAKFRGLLPIVVHQKILPLINGRDNSSRAQAEFCRRWFGENLASALIADLLYSHHVLIGIHTGLSMQASRDYLNYQAGIFAGYTTRVLDSAGPQNFDRKWSDSLSQNTVKLSRMVSVGEENKIDFTATRAQVSKMIDELQDKLYELAPAPDEIKP